MQSLTEDSLMQCSNNYKIDKIQFLEDTIISIFDVIYPIPYNRTIAEKKSYWNEFRCNMEEIAYTLDEILDQLEDIDLEELEDDEED